MASFASSKPQLYIVPVNQCAAELITDNPEVIRPGQFPHPEEWILASEINFRRPYAKHYLQTNGLFTMFMNKANRQQW